MKKYLYYMRKYVENFGFVNRVVWLTVKYNFILIFYNRKKIGTILKDFDIKAYGNEDVAIDNEDLTIICSKIELVINFSPLIKTCLVKSMVKYDFFKRNSHEVTMVYKISKLGDKLYSHSQLDFEK